MPQQREGSACGVHGIDHDAVVTPVRAVDEPAIWGEVDIRGEARAAPSLR